MSVQIDDVEGFYLIPNIFSQDENLYFLDKIQSNKNINICKQIHYAQEFGWKFIPIEKKCIEDYLGPNPYWLDDIFYRAIFGINLKIKSTIKKLTAKPIEYYDHVLINQYEIGDGCVPHIDELNFWEDWVLGVSFGSGCEMILSRGNENKSIYLPVGSVYLLSGDARYKWMHQITYKTSDNANGNQIERKKRISLTFRTINNKYLSEELKKCVI